MGELVPSFHNEHDVYFSDTILSMEDEENTRDGVNYY
jgi:hypothetical protein